MNVLPPVAMTNAILTASNVPETDHAEWDVGSTYALAARVIVTGTTHRVYESAIAGNVGNNPVTDDGTKWIEVSATNRWRAFDLRVGDVVSRAGTITYTFAPGRLTTGMAFFGLNAGSVRVKITEGATTLYDVTRQIVDNTPVVDWFTYFFEPPIYDEETIFTGLPGYVGTSIAVTIDAGAGTAEVGIIAMGQVQNLGETLVGSEIGITDYSRKERDAYGRAIIVPRSFSRDATFQFAMAHSDARRVDRVLSSARATPAVYFAGDAMTQYGATVIGFFTDYTIPLTCAGVSYVTLDIEGLT